MKATKVVYSAGPNELVVTMSTPEALALKEGIENTAPAFCVLHGDSPFARIYQELSRALGRT